MNRLFRWFWIASIGLLLLSCEKEVDRVVDPTYSSPLLLDVRLSHDSLNIDEASSAVTPLGNNSYRISISISGAASRQSSAGTLAGKLNIVRPNSRDIISQLNFSLRSTGAGAFLFDSPVTFDVTRSDAGFLRFDFSILPSEGVESNTLSRTLRVTRRNSRPLLDSLVAPTTVIRPTTDSVTFVFTVTASDSDGYGDIADVSFYLLFPPPASSAIPMFDNGNRDNGDALAGDGIFSRIVSISPRNTLGEKRLVFLARDRFGAVSDSLHHTFYVVE